MGEGTPVSSWPGCRSFTLCVCAWTRASGVRIHVLERMNVLVPPARDVLV